ncbi:MAG: ATP-binding cassette domain-containing protein [Mycoplasmatales bacterium]
MIKCNNLSFSYGNELVIDNLSMELELNKYNVIVGSNGSGKSTLIKLIAGILKPTAGEIINENQNLVGLVFQNPDNQFVQQIVKYDLAFGLENLAVEQAEMEKLIKQMLKMMNISELKDEKIHNLSGGQKQRIAIAGILVMGLKIIILDEATSMLDPENKLNFLKAVKKLQLENEITIISVTHDMEEVAYSDQVKVLSKGKLIAEGYPRDILFNQKILSIANLKQPLIAQICSEINEKHQTNYNFITDGEFKEYLWNLKLKS